MLRYANIMLKRLGFLFLISFLFLPAKTTLGADFSSQKTTASPENQLSLKIGSYTENVPAEKYNAWTKHELTIEYNPAYQSEFEKQNFCPIKKEFICNLLLSQKITAHFQKKSALVFNENAAKNFLTELASRTDSEPQDAKFKVENGNIANFSPEKEGIKLDQEKSLLVLQNFTKNNNSQANSNALELPFISTKPTISTSEANNMGIATLIGQGKSNFRGSPKNRIFNINTALKKFNGILIKPGDEFSFVQTLGDVDGEHGYLPELVIKGNKTEPDFGGGICQVSTTMFRAAIYSGLKIKARTNHAYPVSYYNPQGMDATVFVPQPDLKFINNTPGYILVQTKIEGTELTFDFYGTDDGRKTTVDGPTVTESQPDGSLKTVFTQNVFDKDGNQFINSVFKSTYDSPYRHPHPGGPILTVKPANWSDQEWKDYKKMVKEMQKEASNKAKKA